MKLNKWLFGVVAMAMMASCSDNLSDGPSKGEAEEGGSGYIGINIQLPTVSGTRANDNFEDGELTEYTVKDAVLLLFQGTSDSNAKFTGAFTLNEADPSYDQDQDQITRRSIRVANVTGVDFENKLYALVMINGVVNGMYDLDDPEADWMWNTDNATGIKTGKTVQEFQETILSLTNDKKYKFFSQDKAGNDYASYVFMTNSPLSPVKGGLATTDTPPTVTSALPVLVNLKATTYPTQSEAIANPAGTIHVERAVAKVTCSKFNKETNLTVTVNGYHYKLEVDQIWWDMAQDMAQTYVVRNTNRNPIGTTAGNTNYMWRWNYAATAVSDESNNYYRMLGYLPIGVKEGNVSKEYFRPYFCQVPGFGKASSTKGVHYEDKVFNKETMIFNEAEEPVKWTTDNGTLASPGAFYPLENTFPVEYMKYANTTRVGFWVTFKFIPQTTDGETAPEIKWETTDFYINGMDKTTLYLDDENGNDPLTNLAIAELSDTVKYAAMWKKIEEALDKSEAGKIENVVISDLVKFSYSDNKDGKVEITSVKFKELNELSDKYSGYFTKKPEYTFSGRISELNNLGTYYKYEGGRVFYEVRIKHFGDDNTPWDGDSKTAATTIDESYGNVTKGEITKAQRDNNYLGRYGIVRNNWYDLNVKLIKNLGDPQDPAGWDANWPGKPDDNKDQYIAVELRVLSWAKRTQDVEF